MNILLCYPATDQHLSAVEQTLRSGQVVISDDRSVARLILDADVFCGHAKVPIPWDEVVAQGRLVWIQSSAAGLDHCLAPAVVQSEIVVTSASGLFRHQVAEQTMALLFGLIRRLPFFFRAAAEKKFARQPTDDLRGKTVGIVGFGANGQRIAQVLLPIGCRILATDQFPDQWAQTHPLPPIDQLWPANRLDDLLRQSDVVILTLPLLDQTANLISREQLEHMPRGSYLINVGRGKLVDEHALIDALQSGHLAGAGLDVTATEPLPASSPLWDLPNVIITPHVGAQSHRRYDDVTRFFCENLERFVNGKRLRNLVDKDIGFPLPHARI